MNDNPTYSVISFPGAELPDQYRALVYSKWLRSLRHRNDFFKLIDSECYYRIYPQIIASLLAKPNCRIRLAVLTDDPDIALGFAVYRETVLDYVHVHTDHRQQGIAWHLIPDGTEVFTHLTKHWMGIWSTARFKHLKFNPFA